VFTRRDLLKTTGQAALAGMVPLPNTLLSVTSAQKSIRCINIINFIRAIEPRFKTDLLLPVQKQMEIILPLKLPATWLLQYDSLVSGPFVKYLKDHMADNHEVGFWFEMNEMHCKDAKVEWRGRPGYEWDHLPPVAFTIGYNHEERKKLADSAMHKFKEVFGHYPRSIASWNLDSFTINHIAEHYGADAFAVCRDQIATDGFTIWGAPIAGYYPSKLNCWSPALDKKNQIDIPILRMLGQDPVYYYDRGYKLPGGKRIGEPDTMEPVWTSGRHEHFVKSFFDMIVDAPTQQFAYAQLGQENSFPWNEQEAGYAPQMKALALLRDQQKVTVETMGETGRRFKKAFPMTPTQAQVQLVDPFENTDPSEGSVWYQSQYYRANLHFKGDLPFFRDLTVYSDRNPQPFLDKATRLNDVEQKMPPVLDGYHWLNSSVKDFPGAGGFFTLNGAGDLMVRLSGKPKVREEGKSLLVDLPIQGGRIIHIRFEEKRITIRATLQFKEQILLAFSWDAKKSTFTGLDGQKVLFKDHDFDYSIEVEGSKPIPYETYGWLVILRDELVLKMAQPN
jgi:hypothetical protein